MHETKDEIHVEYEESSAPFFQIDKSEAKPLVITHYITDVDGTIKDTYEPLDGFGYIERQLNCLRLDREWTKFLTQERTPFEIQELLHIPHTAEQQLKKITSNPEILKTLTESQKKSQMAHDGYHEHMEIMRSAGTFRSAFSATPKVFTAISFALSDIDPRDFHAIMTPDSGLELLNAMKFNARQLEKVDAVLARHVSFTGKKPNQEPFRMLREFGVAPENKLYYGEGIPDLDSAFPEGGQREAHTFINVKGARNITWRAQRVNKLISDKRHPLGHEAIMQEISRRGLTDKVITTPNGHRDLINMHKRGEMIYAAPPICPVVQDGRLVLPQGPLRKPQNRQLATAAL